MNWLRITSWPTAFRALVVLFIVPMALIGYPVMSGRLFELDWMIPAGLALSGPATFGYVWLCLNGEPKRQPERRHGGEQTSGEG